MFLELKIMDDKDPFEFYSSPKRLYSTTSAVNSKSTAVPVIMEATMHDQSMESGISCA